jgi:hypothetical protein
MKTQEPAFIPSLTAFLAFGLFPLAQRCGQEMLAHAGALPEAHYLSYRAGAI